MGIIWWLFYIKRDKIIDKIICDKVGMMVIEDKMWEDLDGLFTSVGEFYMFW